MKEELADIAPELSKLPHGQEAFKLPEGYFESFEARVMGRIEAADLQQHTAGKIGKKPARRVALSHYLLAAAAVFAMVIAAVWFLKPVSTIDQTTASVELSDEEIEAYLLDNVQYLEMDQLAMLPETTENEYQPPSTQEKPAPKNTAPLEITPEDVEHLLNDMTEEELEEIL